MIKKYLLGMVIVFLVCMLYIMDAKAQDSLNLSNLDGFNHGFYIDGDSFQDKIANSLSTGDVNGDGISDLIIGAKDAFSLGPTAGNTYVIYGTSNSLIEPFDVGNLDGTDGFAVYGDVENDDMGFSTAAGDFNGDGEDDVVMGAPLADGNGNTQSGEVYVLHSDQLDGSSSYTINGASSSTYLTIYGTENLANLGNSVAIGDVNNDGYDDLLLGAPSADSEVTSNTGKACLIYGYDTSETNPSSINISFPSVQSFSSFYGTEENDFLGEEVHIADILATSGEEMIISALGAGTGGKVYVVGDLSGGSKYSEDSLKIELEADFIFEGDSTGNVGREKSITTGDIDGNGQNDLILTANFDAGANRGKAYVILNPSSGTLNPAALNGTNGFIINGGIDGERLGTSVATGDVNGDGFDDLILGAFTANPGSNSNAGKTYVMYGTDTGFSLEIDISEMSTNEGFVLNGVASGDQSGIAVTSGDYNGDGYSDIATGAPFDAFDKGRVYVMANTNTQEITGNEGFRMLSSPAAGNVLPEIFNSFATQGFVGADKPDAVESNMWIWDTATQQWQAISSLSTAQEAGDGVLFYTFADDNFDGIDDPFPKLLQSPASFFEVDGLSPNSGSIDAVASLTSGDYQLLGNPFGKAINWDAASGWTKTNMSETIYVWSDSASNNSGAWLSWNGTTGSLGSGEISSFQSFFVRAEGGTGALSFDESIIEGTSSLLKNNPKELILELSNEKLSQSLFLSFQDNATYGTDRYDGHHIASLSDTSLTFAALNSEEDLLTINALPSIIEMDTEIQLFLEAVNTEGKTMLGVKKLQNIPEGLSLYIMDNETGQRYDIVENLKFEVFIPEQNSENQNRYSLHLTSQMNVSTNPVNSLPADISLGQNYPNPFNPATVISYDVPNLTEVKLQVYDMLGREVATLVNEVKSSGSYKVNFQANDLSTGIYIYQLKVGEVVLSKKMTLIK